MNEMEKAHSSMSLAGEWHYRLDPNFLGEMRQWYRQELSEEPTIHFPNTLDTAEEGPCNAVFEPGKPARKRKFEGCAWFQKKVQIPKEWSQRRITFLIERCSRSSRVWVDGVFAGREDSICTPHRYSLTSLLTVGEHVLTVEIENAYARSYGAGVFIGRWSSAICDDLHTNWLGMLGRVELVAEPAVTIAENRILSSPKDETAFFSLLFHNDTGAPLSGKVLVEVQQEHGEPVAQVETEFKCEEASFSVSLEVGMRGAIPWDTATGKLYQAKASFTGRAGQQDYQGKRVDCFGYREFSKKGTQFTLNGDPVFLRGSVEYTGFAQTGHPPIDERKIWEKIFRTSQAYGLNHYRFHSYCPPEIAFRVADEMGMLLHVEVPVWPEKPGSGEQKELLEYIEAESKKIITEYYNHPSFVMLGLGNEHQSHFEVLDRIICNLKEYCPDKLYTFSTNFVCDNPTPESDYFISSRTASSHLRIESADGNGRFQGTMNGTEYDYSRSVQDVSVPILVHELGQWTTYPDFDYLKKYEKTIFNPHSGKELSTELAKTGLAGCDKAFQQVSGRFSWLLYKEEIETALRTRGLGGFQLLSLADSPGWGEAFTGALDPFWDPKGFLSGQEMRQFCADVVPLLRMPRFLYTPDELFIATIQVANYSSVSMENAVVSWEVCNEHICVGKGFFEGVCIEKGGLTPIGELSLPLGGITSPEQLCVQVKLLGTAYANSWTIWVYPAVSEEPVHPVYLCNKLDAECERHLEKGEDVLYFAQPEDCQMRDMRFLPVFWSLWWFWWSWREKGFQPATMGILCDPKHPVFQLFPTEAHSNFQWWDILEKEHAFALSPRAKKPEVLLQLVDDYHINQHLAALVQAKVGKGRLIACSVGLQAKAKPRMGANQLYASIRQYMAGDQFNPSCVCTLQEFKAAIQYEDFEN